MLVSCAAVYQNREGETLLRHDGDIGDEPIYELPHVDYERVSCHRPLAHEWAKIGNEDGVTFIKDALIKGITMERKLYYTARPAQLAPIVHGVENQWVFADLSKRDAAFGYLVLGPMAKRLHWYLQNEGPIQ